MARVQLASFNSGVVQTTTGDAVVGVTANVYQHGTTTPVTVFAAETGAGTLAQPLTTDSKGHVPGWVDEAQRLDTLIQGVTTPLEAFSAGAVFAPVAPATFTAGTISTIPCSDKGTAGQTANLHNFLDSNSVVLSAINNLGTLVGPAASHNMPVGLAALGSITSGDFNTAVGNGALGAMTTANNSTAVGYQAALVNTAANTVAIGSGAMVANTTGASNVAVGQNALKSNLIGTSSVAIGTSAMANTTGSSNTAVGQSALAGTAASATGTNNVAVGFQSMQVITTATKSTGLGYQALNALTTGNNNLAVGATAMLANTTGAGNTALGANALASNLTAANNVAVGLNAAQNILGAFNTAVGTSAMGGAAGSTATQNTAVGAQTMQSAVTTATNNTVVGYQAGQNITTGTITAVGAGAGQAVTTGGCTALGVNAAAAVTTATAVIAIGQNALMVCTASDIVGVGGQALTNNTTGTVNTALGPSAEYMNTTGGNNVGVGGDALHENTAGNNNTAVGRSALYFCQATATTGVGVQALYNLIDGIENVAVGGFAGGGLVPPGNGPVHGGSNTILGYFAGNTDGTTATSDQSSMTLLGERAQATTSNVIVLGKAIATRPNMIFGGVGAAAAFGSGVGVFAIANAAADPTTNPTGGGILYASGGALKWRGSSGTVTTIAVA